MDDEVLIEFVRKNSVLFDLSNPKYMDTEYKNGVWNKIGIEMKTTGKKLTLFFICMLFITYI